MIDHNKLIKIADLQLEALGIHKDLVNKPYRECIPYLVENAIKWFEEGYEQGKEDLKTSLSEY